MPKPRIPNQRNANIEHKKRTERYVMLIQQVYDRLANEASRRAAMTGHNPEEPFTFADYPETAEAMKLLQAEFIGEVCSIIMAGTSNEWKESNLVQDLVAEKVLTAYTEEPKKSKLFARYYQTNPDALKAFQQRRDSGMKLSDRVWNLSEQYKAELEMAISAAIAPGVSAQQLSQDVRKFLNEPDLMFRRFRYKDDAGRWRKKWKRRITDEDGKVRFVDYDRDSYKTGPGVYKSSFKNAQRLARTEINMAYRAAEQERWKQFDFVVGYEVKITQNGKHVEDICDCLKGKYRKDFIFRGWHPACMCYSIPILKTEDEFWKLDDKPSENEVTDVPQGFKDWVENNEERIEKAAERGKLPYFLRDNPTEVDKILHSEKVAEIPASTTLSIQERAAIRHANRDEEQIRTEWANRKINMLWDYVNDGYLPKECVNKINELKDDIIFGDFDEFNRKIKPLLSQGYRHSTRTQAEVERIEKVWRQKLIRDITLESARYEPDNVLMDAYISSMRKARISGDKDMFIGDYENAKRWLVELRRQYTSELIFSTPQYNMFDEFEKYHSIKRGKPMTVREADIQSANPDFIPNSPTHINCQTCAPAYVLRSQGFDIIATPRTPGSVNDWIAYSHSFDIWENADGSKAKPTLYREWLDSHGYKNMSAKRYQKFYEEATTEPGIYITTIGWASGGGHATIIQRFADGTLAYIEPQVYEASLGIKRSLLELCNEGDTNISKYSQRGIMRVDDKVLKHYCKDFLTGRTYDIWSIFGVK